MRHMSSTVLAVIDYRSYRFKNRGLPLLRCSIEKGNGQPILAFQPLNADAFGIVRGMPWEPRPNIWDILIFVGDPDNYPVKQIKLHR